MKPQKALQTCLSTFLVGLFILAPLNSSETVAKSQSRSFSIQQIVAAEGSTKEKATMDYNALDLNRKSKNQDNSDKINTEKKHTDEEKHNNHAYSYDWIKNRKKILAIFLRSFTMIFVAVSYIAVLLCGYMSILH